MHTWVFPIFWLLWITLLGAFTYKFLCENIFLKFLLSIYLEVELLGLTQCLTFWRTATLLSKVAEQFYILPSNIWESHFFTYLLSATLVITCHFDSRHVSGMNGFTLWALLHLRKKSKKIQAPVSPSMNNLEIMRPELWWKCLMERMPWSFCLVSSRESLTVQRWVRRLSQVSQTPFQSLWHWLSSRNLEFHPF